MRKTLLSLALAATLLASPGCASLVGTFGDEYHGPLPFCGTIADAVMLGKGIFKPRDQAVGALRGLLAVMAFFDLPFSLAVDAVLLPVQTVMQIARGPMLLADLEDPDVEVRRKAAWRARDYWPIPSGTEEALVKLLLDGDANVERGALYSLLEIEDIPVSAVPALIAHIKAADHLRENSIDALKLIGPDADAAIGVLLPLRELHVDPNLRFKASQALNAIDPKAYRVSADPWLAKHREKTDPRGGSARD